MIRWKILGLLGALALCGDSVALAAGGPSVARPSFPIDGKVQTSGLVFEATSERILAEKLLTM